jgi:hypothetical protein
MAFDSVRQRIVLFGGWGFSGELNDTWEWDGTEWIQVGDTGPSPREGHSMSFDVVRQRVVLFGGALYPAGTLFNDTWEWDGKDWTEVADMGPVSRCNAAMVPMGTQTVLFGGYLGNSFAGDTWEWNELRWTQRQDIGPEQRCCHAMAHDSTRDRVVLFGGYGTGALGDTWELPNPTDQ